MLNLAIECSSATGSVALYRENVCLVERPLPDNVGSVQSLAATIEQLLSLHSARRADLISVTNGPGSFTGLRSGLATVKMLAFAWQVPVAPVDTLRAIAAHLEHAAAGSSRPAIVVPVLNAFRQQVFASAWLHAPSGPPHELAAAQVVDAAAWMRAPWASLHLRPPSTEAPLPPAGQAAVVVCGPGLRNYPPDAGSGVDIAAEELWAPTASDVARCGWSDYLGGGKTLVSAQELQPNYVRASAAEEKAAEEKAAEEKAAD
ncbi:MAG: tRNA (adenosine(37)-N6)-threonylcarbamoyltransferase complex dimerization subunit type 1 TsaB [Planctomycetales bacterium]|nr:tRNA (adenosine(37)-N6)-threonylcarbamoyltransferase complex dimerization subunit type 1 TsaB [Planctomycetales bacterium]